MSTETIFSKTPVLILWLQNCVFQELFRVKVIGKKHIQATNKPKKGMGEKSHTICTLRDQSIQLMYPTHSEGFCLGNWNN